MHRLAKLLFVAGLCLLLAALWKKHELPAQGLLQPALQEEPLQKAVTMPAFERSVGQINYRIQPLYRYELWGLVVSRHDSDTWWDYLHKEWNDRLNVADLCVLWGDNLNNASYGQVSFSSGQFTCYFQTDSNEVYQAFDQTAISNNHLLSDDPELIRRIKNTRVGDQIHFRGYLAEYSHEHGTPFRRGTSTTRSDTGNGACETVFLEEFTILKQGGGPWYKLQWLGIALMVLGSIAWIAAPVRLRN